MKAFVGSDASKARLERTPAARSLSSWHVGGYSSASGAFESRSIVYGGNLTIGANSSLLIVNTTYTVNGYVFVYGNLTLVNSTLVTLPPAGDFLDPYGLWLLDGANVTFLSSTTLAHVASHNSSRITIEGSNITDISRRVGGTTWPPNIDTFGDSQVLVNNSILRWVETWDRSVLTVNNSKVTTIGAGGGSEASVYSSDIRGLGVSGNSIANVYSTRIAYRVNIDLSSSVFLWNSTFPGVGGNDTPYISIAAFGNGSTAGLVGVRLQSKPTLPSGLKDGKAAVEISAYSDVSGELRFYWGVFVSEADTFQRLGLDKEGVRIVAWNGSSWEILQDQGSVDFGQNSGGYFWGRFNRAGIYALVSYPVSGLNLWFLLILPVAGVLLIILRQQRKRAARRVLQT